MPRRRDLRSAVAEIEERLDNGEGENDLEIVVLPPDQVDQLSDEENIDDNITGYGEQDTLRDTVGSLEAGVRGDSGVQADSQRKSKEKEKKRKWKKRINYENPLSDHEPESLFREHPELCFMSPFELFSITVLHKERETILFVTFVMLYLLKFRPTFHYNSM